MTTMTTGDKKMNMMLPEPRCVEQKGSVAMLEPQRRGLLANAATMENGGIA